MRMKRAQSLLQRPQITDTRTAHEACKRWVPWLCAYTGARPGEMTQLRGADVIERDGVHAIRITPAAGTVKGGTARIVPLHEHLIAQGFLRVRSGAWPGTAVLQSSRVSHQRRPNEAKEAARCTGTATARDMGA